MKIDLRSAQALSRLRSLSSVRSVFRAGGSVFLQILGLGSQLVLRILMSAALGASASYDAWILALLVGGMVAQLGFQSLSSALLPRVSDLVTAGHPNEAEDLFRRALRAAFYVSLPIALVASAAALGFTEPYGASFPLLLLLIVLAWGSFGGVYILQRQALNFLKQPLRGQAAGLLPMAGLLICAVAWSGSNTLALASAALVGFVLSVLLSGRWLSVAWASVRLHASERVASVSLRPLWVAMTPIILASLNSQGLSFFEQGLAASWGAGGAAMFGTALALGRLPNMLADAAVVNVGYGKMLRAVSASRIEPGEATNSKVRDSFRMLLRIQTFLIFPAAAFMALFAHPTVSVLFQRGKFLPQDVAQTAAILSLIPLAAMGFMLQSVNVQMLVAWGRPGLALRYEVIAAILAATMDLLMLKLFGLSMLPLGGAIAVSIASMLTFRELKGLTGAVSWTDLLEVWKRPAIGVAAAAVVSWLLGQLLLNGLPTGFAGLPRLVLLAAILATIFYGLSIPKMLNRLRELQKL